jgi:hypothetical protein
VIHKQPLSVSARSSATHAPISESGSVMMWSGRLDEEHRLEREHVRADQRRDDVDDPVVQQVALVDLHLPVEHVDALKMSVVRLGVIEQLLHIRAVQHAAHDQVAARSEGDIVGDRDHGRTVRRDRRGSHGHNVSVVVRD